MNPNPNPNANLPTSSTVDLKAPPRTTTAGGTSSSFSTIPTVISVGNSGAQTTITILNKGSYTSTTARLRSQGSFSAPTHETVHDQGLNNLSLIGIVLVVVVLVGFLILGAHTIFSKFFHSESDAQSPPGEHFDRTGNLILGAARKFWNQIVLSVQDPTCIL